MKRALLFFTFILCLPCVSGAQSKRLAFEAWYQVGANPLKSESEFKSIELAFAPGWVVGEKVVVRLQTDLSVGLFDMGGQNTYRTNMTLGPGIGYDFVRDPRIGILSAAGTVGNTVVNRDWNFHYYDLGFGWSLPQKSPMKMVIGLGVRHRDSHKAAVRDYCNFYVKLGFRLN